MWRSQIRPSRTLWIDNRNHQGNAHASMGRNDGEYEKDYGESVGVGELGVAVEVEQERGGEDGVGV